MDWQSQLAKMRSSLPMADEPLTNDTPEAPAPSRQYLHIRYERKGRGGKSATIISGFTLSPDEIAQVAADLKKSIGVGGSWRGDEILLQGDCREAATNWLRSHSHIVK